MKKIEPLKNPLRGEITVPADKSISHRAIMLASLADKPVEIKNFLAAADCLSTISCMKNLGAEIERNGDKVLVSGKIPVPSPQSPVPTLDAGNSGTTVRLLTGLLAGLNISATFTGDESLSRRPMGRIIKPLEQMGAKIFGREQKYLPLEIKPSPKSFSM